MKLTPHQIFVGVITAIVAAIMIPLMIYVAMTIVALYG